MNLILSIYTGTVYREVYLPVLNDADYELSLPADVFGLSRDLRLSMEAMDGEWRFLSGKDYRILRDDVPFEGKALKSGQLIHVRSDGEKALAILVWASATELSASRKYRVMKNRVTIGKDPENDICYPAQRLISRRHAEIVYRGGAAFLRDNSKNGTYLNGHLVAGESQLYFGDMISLYGLTILFLGAILAVSWLDTEVVIRKECMWELEELPPVARPPQETADYSEETLIHISPRILPKLHTEPETIEGVPAKKEGDGRPAWMSILPSLTMVLPMLLGFLLMSRGNGGGFSFGIVIAGGSAIVGVTWAIINYRYATKERKAQEKLRLERYEEYLVECTDRIREKFEFNRASLLETYPDAETCGAFTADATMLWNRKRRHPDFLSLRVGLGDMPFQVQISAPKRGFTLKDDELSERPERIAQSFSTMRNVPVCVDLLHHGVIGILTDGNKEQAIGVARMLVTQIVANHCYTDVKMGFLYRGGQNTAPLWNYVRWLPHVWNEERSLRYIASDESGMNDVLYALTQILRGRSEQAASSTVNKPVFSPHYVLFVEDPELLESQMISKYLFGESGALGVTTVILAESYELLPSACDLVIEKGRAFRGVYGADVNAEDRRDVVFDEIRQSTAESLAQRMSAWRVRQLESGSSIPNSLTFFEMHDIQRLEELDVVEHWRKNRTYETMRAAIGQKMGGQTCYLDINEKHHGPHGLVAGTTGSGKSETLQTYILSLAINFSPQDVGFFIIDFKGGGMANLFSDLPHMIGQISNLSGNQIRRAMVSIKSENLRRQRIFGEFGVNHIDAYTKLVKNREATVPIPHLLIIIDEFAELKREQPEFMRELISVAQVGRSLGVHLILATQKPSGTVDENIWSNTKFKLCLRVADKQDSNDMLHKPDAAFLTQAGRGYLQVGNDEIYELFQSGWSGAAYDENGESVRSSAALLDEQGREPVSANRARTEQKKKQMRGWVAQIVRAIQAAAKQMELTEHPAGLDPERRTALAQRTIALLNAEEIVYPTSATDLRRMEEITELLPEDALDADAAAEYLIERFRRLGKKLPERPEKTQLDAVVRYLAEMAKKTGFVNEQSLWMPLLPERLSLRSLPGYAESSFRDGAWADHSGGFRLSAYVGMVDDPEHQQQFPLSVDLAEKGHLAVVGGVSSGKSTFLQTLIMSMITTYSPAEVNVYAVDYSSQMLCAFEGDAHVGGVVIEGEDEKLDKLFVMLADLLQERKTRIRGGSFLQYMQMSREPMPAVVVVIDGYANFNEKTESRYENQLLELSRSAEGYGIYLVIACGGFGNGELQTKIAGNMRQSICLELGDKYLYGDALHTMHFDVLPEQNVKGRGLALVDGSVLEYQAALSCEADNDYARGEEIRRLCAQMSECWTGLRAAPIPTIPEKPLWEDFRLLPAYQNLIRRGGMLPVAYIQETAGLYAFDLSGSFCTLILGGDRSGKSIFLRNVMCAAKDLGGELHLIDLAGADAASAEQTGAHYVADPTALAEMLRGLIGVTNERGAERKRLRAEGLDDEEIYQSIAKKYPPLFVFIADMKVFMDSIYKKQEGVGALASWFENIFEKGQLLNVFFFGAAGLSTTAGMTDKAAWLSFIKSRRGVLLGGELNRQNIFQYQNVRYAEQGRRFKPGMGYATSQEEQQNVELIVVPNNRRHKSE